MTNSWDAVIGTGPYRDTLKRSLEYADSNGWKLNPDNERVEKVVGLMTMNHSSTGRYFCPCKQSHPLETEKDTLCPCPQIFEEIEKEGHCFCRLFYS